MELVEVAVEQVGVAIAQQVRLVRPKDLSALVRHLRASAELDELLRPEEALGVYYDVNMAERKLHHPLLSLHDYSFIVRCPPEWA